jgi:hypothetical protein
MLVHAGRPTDCRVLGAARAAHPARASNTVMIANVLMPHLFHSSSLVIPTPGSLARGLELRQPFRHTTRRAENIPRLTVRGHARHAAPRWVQWIEQQYTLGEAHGTDKIGKE